MQHSSIILRNKIATYLNHNPDTIFFYWKGRVALFAILKSMGIQKDDEVILPGFTCVVVPNAVKYLGAKPIYADINPVTLNPDLDQIKKIVTSKTKVIVCQNTFGLSTQVDDICNYAKQKNIFTIEDCTHGFGGTFKGQPNGTNCDAAFFSTQWNKPFSTGIGGFSLINNSDVLTKIKQINRDLIQPSFSEKINLYLLIHAKKYLLTPFTYWFLRSFYRLLSKYKLVIGSSDQNELTGLTIPPDYFKAISNVQIKEGISQLSHFDKLILLRKQNAFKYSNFLKKNNKIYVREDLFDNHSFLTYPVFVSDKKRFEENAEKYRIELGDWFCSPIHPIKKDLEKWDIIPENIPTAIQVSQSIINLPTDTINIERVIKFLEKNIDIIQ